MVCIVDNIVKSRMKWAGNIIKMKDEILPKRSKMSQKRRKTTQRWKDCIKRDLRRAKEEDKWREKTIHNQNIYRSGNTTSEGESNQ